MSYQLRDCCVNLERELMEMRAQGTETAKLPYAADTVVAVVGMGHMTGIAKHLQAPANMAQMLNDLNTISRIPTPRSWAAFLFKFAVVPVAVIATGVVVYRRVR
jgi:pheromone shutdown protein TraB